MLPTDGLIAGLACETCSALTLLCLVTNMLDRGSGELGG